MRTGHDDSGKATQVIVVLQRNARADLGQKLVSKRVLVHVHWENAHGAAVGIGQYEAEALVASTSVR